MRWFLTRRAAIALAISGVMVLGTLNYSRYATAVQEAERKRLEAAQQLTQAVAKGEKQGLSEEVVLAPEGASGG
jgi:hypothetical protein